MARAVVFCETALFCLDDLAACLPARGGDLNGLRLGISVSALI